MEVLRTVVLIAASSSPPIPGRRPRPSNTVAAGRQAEEIAVELFVSLNTVEKRVTRIFQKWRSNRTAATDHARQFSLLS